VSCRPHENADLRVHGGGTVYLLRAVSPRGEAWIAEHIPVDAIRFAGGAVVVEHRFIHDIVAGAVRDGLSVR
jgi:hypothetical protein